MNRGGPDRPRHRSTLLGAGLATLAACAPADREPRALLDETRAALAAPRALAPRLTAAVEYRPCAENAAADSPIPRTRCAPDGARVLPSAAVSDAAARAAAAVRHGPDHGALHASALVDLLWGDEKGNSIDRAISALGAAARLAPRPAAALGDLAAAHLVRAERRQQPRDLLDAVEAAGAAVALEPRDPVARFNLATALTRLTLGGEAAAAWEAYLAIDSTTGWAAEARRRLREERARAAAARAPSVGATAAAVAEYVRASPQGARTLGWEATLGDWARAVIAGEAASAAALLELAARLGEALANDHGDATLADAARAIRAHASDSAATRALALAHLAYAEAQAAYAALRYPAAETAFSRALTAGEPSPALRLWATLGLGATLIYQGRPAEGERLLRAVAAGADTLRHPALAGRAAWSLGSMALRRGEHDAGVRAIRAAARHFERARERENHGAVLFVDAEASFDVGDDAAAYATMHAALAALRPYPGSVWRHNALQIAARAAASTGLARAAEHLHAEDVAASVRAALPAYAAEARLSRARHRAASGDRRGAAADIAAARPLVARLPDGLARRWLTADLQLASAEASLHAAPAQAARALDSAVAFFAGVGNPVRLLPALAARAEAALAGGRVEEAAAALDRAMKVLDERGATIASAPERASMLDATRVVVDRMVQLHLGAGRAPEALAQLERARVSLAPVRARPRGARAPARPAAPAGGVALEYAVVQDTLRIWSVVGRDVRVARASVDRERLLRTVDSVTTLLELRADEEVVRPQLALLYEWLVRPVEARLGADGSPVVLVLDGEVAGVPFPALYDARRGRYLVQAHALRTTATLAEASLPAARGGREHALLVAHPALDEQEFRELPRLPGATAEVQAIAATYPRRTVLAGEAASRSALTAAARRAELLHYAGHAVFDDARPERSFLALAPEGARGGRLTALDLARDELSSLRLVVLSACQTSRATSRRSGGFAGLAGAFLAAGAGGVVGSIWRVDDELTRPLMVELHRAWRAGGNGAAALQAAQLAMLRSGVPARRSPAAWAAFRYAGR